MSIIPTSTQSTTPHVPTATLPPGTTVDPTANSTTSGLGMNGVNSDTFLQLLVAQMKYQDPNNPVNSTQFLSQTASFEEVQELGTLQTAITNLVTSQQNTAATSMLGQTVQATDSNGNSISGKVSGIQLTSNGPVLQIGNQTASLSSVTAVGSAVTGAAGTGAAGTGTSVTGPGTTSSTTGSSTTNTTQAGTTANSSTQTSA